MLKMPIEVHDPEFIRRFWSRVDTSDPDACWVVPGAKTYGTTYVGGLKIRSHRVAFTIANGHDPGDLAVRHVCDNPPCRNPAHLLKGTEADNSADRMARHRHYRLPKGRNRTTRTRVVPFRLAPDRADRLTDYAERHGLRVSVVLRNLVEDLLSSETA